MKTNKEILDVVAKIIKEHGGRLEIELFQEPDSWQSRIVEDPDMIDDLLIDIDCTRGHISLKVEYYADIIDHSQLGGIIGSLQVVKGIFDKIETAVDKL